MCRLAGDDCFAPVVVAGASHSDLIEAQLSDAEGALLVVEPEAKNSAPAIALAAARCCDAGLLERSPHHRPGAAARNQVLIPPAPAPDTRCRGEVLP